MDMTLKGKGDWGRYSHSFNPAIHMTWVVQGFFKRYNAFVPLSGVLALCPTTHICEKVKRKKLLYWPWYHVCVTQQQEVMKVEHATEQHVKQELVHQVQLQSRYKQHHPGVKLAFQRIGQLQCLLQENFLAKEQQLLLCHIPRRPCLNLSYMAMICFCFG